MNKGNNSSSPISNADDGEWVEAEVTVNSGACDTVIPVSSCSFKVLPSYQTRHEMEYEVANGASIPNLGERKCIICTPGSLEEKRITFQVVDVHKPLLSVTRAADAGYDCLLTDAGGAPSLRLGGDRIPIRRKGDLYVMRYWVKSDSDPASDVARPR